MQSKIVPGLAGSCQEQTPAKFYKTLRPGRREVVLSDPCSDTAGAEDAADISSLTEIDDTETIARLIEAFTSWRFEVILPSTDTVGVATRRERTWSLAARLNEIIEARRHLAAGSLE